MGYLEDVEADDPLGTHYGIVVAHYPNELSTFEMNRQIFQALEGRYVKTMSEADV